MIASNKLLVIWYTEIGLRWFLLRVRSWTFLLPRCSQNQQNCPGLVGPLGRSGPFSPDLQPAQLQLRQHLGPLAFSQEISHELGAVVELPFNRCVNPSSHAPPALSSQCYINLYYTSTKIPQLPAPQTCRRRATVHAADRSRAPPAPSTTLILITIQRKSLSLKHGRRAAVRATVCAADHSRAPPALSSRYYMCTTIQRKSLTRPCMQPSPGKSKQPANVERMQGTRRRANVGLQTMWKHGGKQLCIYSGGKRHKATAYAHVRTIKSCNQNTNALSSVLRLAKGNVLGQAHGASGSESCTLRNSTVQPSTS